MLGLEFRRILLSFVLVAILGVLVLLLLQGTTSYASVRLAQTAITPPTNASASITSIPTVEPTVTSTPDTVTNEQLLEHFEKISSRSIQITQWVLVIVTGSGILGTFLYNREVRKAHTEVENLQTKINEIRQELVVEKDGFHTTVNEIKIEITRQEGVVDNLEQQLLNTSENVKREAAAITNRLSTLLEARDINQDLRRRAVQKLMYMDDIAAISILIERLREEEIIDIRAEAAYGIGQLLSTTAPEAATLAHGIDALIQGSRDREELVRLESIASLGKISLERHEMPRNAIQRLREAIKYDVSKEVKRAARDALRNINEQRAK